MSTTTHMHIEHAAPSVETDRLTDRIPRLHVRNGDAAVVFTLFSDTDTATGFLDELIAASIVLRDEILRKDLKL